MLRPAVAALRLGVLVDRPDPPRWMRKAVDAVVANPQNANAASATLAFVGVLDARDVHLPTFRGQSHSSVARSLYNRLDQWKASSQLDILADQRFSETYSTLAVQSDGEALTLADSATQQLTQLDLDLLVVFSNRLQPTAVSRYARLGAAGFVLSDYSESGESSDGLDEVLNSDAVVTVRLEWFAPGDCTPSRVIETATNADRYSAALTRATAAWHCVPLLERLVDSLRYDPANRDNESVAKVQGRIRRTRERQRKSVTLALTSLMLKFASSRVAISRLAKRSDLDRWELAYKYVSPVATHTHPALSLTDFRPLRPPPDRFWADPFPMRVADRTFVLFEELQYADERGYICALEMGPDGPIGDPVVVLDRPYHLSYPFVFEHAGDHYMLPETSLEGRLELYRAVKPPFEWTLDRVLMDDSSLCDATIAEIGGQWWLFACRLIPGLREWNDLMIYRASSPFGPWIPHPRNPVVSDARHARPAGALYQHDGSWYRPAQDCSRTYGGALTIRRIVRLNETEFEEEEALRLDPAGSGEIDGVHTFNRLGALCMIDLKRRPGSASRNEPNG